MIEALAFILVFYGVTHLISLVVSGLKSKAENIKLKNQNKHLEAEMQAIKSTYKQKEEAFERKKAAEEAAFQKYKSDVERGFESRSALYPFIAEMIGNAYEESNRLIADALEFKKCPAKSAADTVRGMKK